MRQFQKRRRTAHVKGWDAALIGNQACPYNRDDFVRSWSAGFRECIAGKKTPTLIKLHLGMLDEDTAPVFGGHNI